MSAKPVHPTREIVSRLKQDLADLLAEGVGEGLTGPARKKITEDVAEIRQQLADVLREVDPIRQPESMFDPSEPSVVGRFVALAMVAQPKVPLGELDRFYGSGVYALYYNGAFPLYERISKTETPIYVGMADPAQGTAKTPFEQGERLSRRLNDHRRNVTKADNLDLADFTCRALVVQSGWQQAAESYLIRFFRPVWNKEIGLIFGFGKHGDSADTRKNKRSPWDTLHEGRGWAGAAAIEDAKSEATIHEQVAGHFDKTPTYRDLDSVLEAFVQELRQQS